MRDFFIRSFERLIGAIIVLNAIGIVIAASAVALQAQVGWIWTVLAVLIVGGLYVILMGGALYLGLGIYHNTRRTAEALERQVVGAGQDRPMSRLEGWEVLGAAARREPPVRRAGD